MQTDNPKKAIILAAGYGLRMLPISGYLPKPLLPVKGKPLILHELENIEYLGIKEVIIVIEHVMGPFIKQGLDLQYKGPCEIKYMYQKEGPNITPSMMGIAPSMMVCEEAIGQDTFLLVLADSYLHDFKSLDPKLFKGNTFITIKSKDKLDEENNIFAETDINKNILNLYTKYEADNPLKNRFIAAGTLTSDIFRYLRKNINKKEDYVGGQFYPWPSVQEMINDGIQVKSIDYDGIFKNINTNECYEALLRDLLC